MDTAKLLDALKMIKSAFVNEKFMDAKLNDGTIIRFDGEKLEVGLAVMVVSEQGVVPIPDGEYFLEDGTEFKTINGLVSEVKIVEEVVAPVEPAAPEAVAAPAPVAEMSETQAKTIIESIIKETHFALVERIEKLESANKVAESFAKENNELKDEVAKQKETILKMFALVEKIASEPSAKPTESKKSFSVSEFKKAYKQDLLNIEETI